MNPRFLTILIITFTLITGCTAAPVSPTQSADAMSTLAFQQVYIMQTQTAIAASPTPTVTPAITETPPPKKKPTAVHDGPPTRPMVTEFAACWTGPGPNYTLISNISPKKYVELLGIGSVPGWYIIRNPYFHNPCWIEAIYLKLDPVMNMAKYSVMTPGP